MRSSCTSATHSSRPSTRGRGLTSWYATEEAGSRIDAPPVYDAPMSNRERLTLVDGSWLVYRAFFAPPSNLATRDGLPTNAIFGFATMFKKLFAGRMPERGAVLFDTPEPTHREQRFPAYKAQRPSAPDDLRKQFPVIDRL